MTIEIVHDAASKRVSAMEDGKEVGYVTYVISDGRLDIEHTKTVPEMRGRGIAGQLVDWTLDLAEREGLKAVATCSYAAKRIGDRKCRTLPYMH